MTIVVRGELGTQTGWVVDYGDMKKALTPIIDQLDHRYLNDIPGLENPTSEVIARWVYERLKEPLPLLHQIIINETCTTECRYPAD